VPVGGCHLGMCGVPLVTPYPAYCCCNCCRQGVGSYLRDRTTLNSWERPALYSQEEADALEQHPAILHFTGEGAATPGATCGQGIHDPCNCGVRKGRCQRANT
jgi:hypothetical protein